MCVKDSKPAPRYKLRNCILNKLKESHLTDPETNFYFHKNYPIKDKCEGRMQLTNSAISDIDLSIVLYGKGPYHRLPYNDLLKYWKLASADKNSQLGTVNFNKVVITKIEYISSTTPDPISFKVSPAPDLEYFWLAVDYLTQTYDDMGGYQMPITRSIPGYDPLPPGWYGAMAQGHALSLISRAYHKSPSTPVDRSGKSPRNRYFADLLSILQPFKLRSEDGGIKNLIYDEFVWYEEYPMLPNGQFVLNGFMYSLVGVFDALLACRGETEDVNAVACSHTAKVVFSEGFRSLYKVLPMFDNGFGSNYDLRGLGEGFYASTLDIHLVSR